jgi:membrane-associated phospholipid phosphatase
MARIAQLEVDSQGNPVLHYARNARDLATYVHFDALYEAYLNACLILLDAGAAFDPGNPYLASRNQEGFGTFGAPHVLSLVCEVATRALKAVWWQKWGVHRRLRPEEFGGRIQSVRTGAADYPIDDEVLQAPVLDRVESQFGSYLLPLGFPEGSPTHPAYGAGHATVAGACVTMLKAFFDEAFPIPQPQVASDDGLALGEYRGALTVGGELDKLASNVAMGRVLAGVHWRSDAAEGLKLGETVAISLLEDLTATYPEDFRGFSLTTFDGTRITI